MEQPHSGGFQETMMKGIQPLKRGIHMKMFWHVIGLALAVAILSALIEFANPLLPIFGGGAFPEKAILVACIAKAIGVFVKELIIVAAIYLGKIKAFGSHSEAK
jgi:hypothetical protein